MDDLVGVLGPRGAGFPTEVYGGGLGREGGDGGRSPIRTRLGPGSDPRRTLLYPIRTHSGFDSDPKN